MKNMKRVIIFALVAVSLCAITFPALAASPPCGHSKAVRTYVSHNYYEMWDRYTHVTIWTEDWSCPTCGPYNYMYQRMFDHTWSGNRCIYCGYTK